MQNKSKCIREGSSHYLGDKQDFDVSSKGPSSGISNCNGNVGCESIDVVYDNIQYI